MHAALRWRSYFFALSANPKRWQKDQVCALGTPKILSTGDSAQVMLRTAQSAEVIRTNVRDDDWTLRAFINLHFRDRTGGRAVRDNASPTDCKITAFGQRRASADGCLTARHAQCDRRHCAAILHLRME